jgi:hypothetical protein
MEVSSSELSPSKTTLLDASGELNPQCYKWENTVWFASYKIAAQGPASSSSSELDVSDSKSLY